MIKLGVLILNEADYSGRILAFYNPSIEKTKIHNKCLVFSCLQHIF